LFFAFRTALLTGRAISTSSFAGFISAVDGHAANSAD
jgi:hypothetical protein